jgi:hypothetical protein
MAAKKAARKCKKVQKVELFEHEKQILQEHGTNIVPVAVGFRLTDYDGFNDYYPWCG